MAKFWSYFGNKCYAIGQVFIVVCDQIFKNNLAIWSHFKGRISYVSPFQYFLIYFLLQRDPLLHLLTWICAPQGGQNFRQEVEALEEGEQYDDLGLEDVQRDGGETLPEPGTQGLIL